jgi:hypothetical protein
MDDTSVRRDLSILVESSLSQSELRDREAAASNVLDFSAAIQSESSQLNTDVKRRFIGLGIQNHECCPEFSITSVLSVDFLLYN